MKTTLSVIKAEVRPIAGHIKPSEKLKKTEEQNIREHGSQMSLDNVSWPRRLKTRAPRSKFSDLTGGSQLDRRPEIFFDKNEYLSAGLRYDAEWSLLDETVYRLCRENPDNSSRLSVFAKVFIIGRSYETGIERQVKTRGTQGSSISQVAECLLRHGKRLDKWIGSLSGEIDSADLRAIVDVHGRILNLLKPTARKLRSPRSFVSQYLHFHNTAVPIYDSYAERSLKALVPWDDALNVFNAPGAADREYDRYVKRFQRLCSIVEQNELIVSVKRLNHYLVWKADENALPLSP